MPINSTAREEEATVYISKLWGTVCCSQMLSSVFSQQPGKVMAFVSCSSIYLSRKKGRLFGYFLRMLNFLLRNPPQRELILSVSQELIQSIQSVISENVATQQKRRYLYREWCSELPTRNSKMVQCNEVVNVVNIESTLFCFLK